MNNPNIEPVIKNGGSAFRGNTRQAKRPLAALPDRDRTDVVRLADFCEGNFISRYQGYRAIEKRLLIGFRRYGNWWVRSNPECIEELLNYLGLDELLFDASTY